MQPENESIFDKPTVWKKAKTLIFQRLLVEGKIYVLDHTDSYPDFRNVPPPCVRRRAHLSKRRPSEMGERRRGTQCVRSKPYI